MAVRQALATPAAPAQEISWDMDDADRQLRRVFGFDSFRPSQRRIISNMAAKRDTLAVMPTGSGKSLCYQLPAILSSGLTVVVSPLIALMEDQVVQLRELEVPAAFLNSTMPHDAQLNVMRGVRQGRIKLLYAAPETLLKPETIQLLDDARVDCLAIDEAHCISEWGHDFRPEYRQLGGVRRRLPNAVCLALTATATLRVRQDIKDNLGMTGADEVVTTFDRDNLFLSARERTTGRRQLQSFLNSHRGESGLIYCLTRKEVEQVTADLIAAGWPAIPYHAGLDNDTRRLNHRRFVFEDDAIVVATIAFGMGINKSNVRFVVHYGTPKDVESYYQQIGRAGRDGLRADCLLLHSRHDVNSAQFHINNLPQDQRAPAAMRLREMTDFAETTMCRRRPLLRYFDEIYEPDNCGMCDNCLATPRETIDLTIPAQKFLSCVKRTKELFGATYIIDVLRGSKDKRILSNGHDRLSTYGIGRDYSKKQWLELTRQFVEQGLLQRDPTHGGLSLTVEGIAVLRGKAFHGHAPEAEPVMVGVPGAQKDYDRELFELLRAKRSELALEQGVPPYMIFSDRSLQEMAIYFPQSDSELVEIHGIGEGKLARYGAAMLAVLQPYCRSKAIQPRPKDKGALRRLGTAGRQNSSSWQPSADLFNAGETIATIAARLSLNRDTVISHLWKAAHFPPGVNETYLCREVEVDWPHLDDLFTRSESVDIYDLRRLYNATHEGFTAEIDWLLRLILVNRAQQNKPAPSDRQEFREAILECVKSLPGELPRSGLAGLLRGTPTGRIVKFESHPVCGWLGNDGYFEVMAVIDTMIDDGEIVLGDNRRLYPKG